MLVLFSNDRNDGNVACLCGQAVGSQDLIALLIGFAIRWRRRRREADLLGAKAVEALVAKHEFSPRIVRYGIAVCPRIDRRPCRIETEAHPGIAGTDVLAIEQHCARFRRIGRPPAQVAFEGVDTLVGSFSRQVRTIVFQFSRRIEIVDVTAGV
jgi:hypothetical protein